MLDFTHMRISNIIFEGEKKKKIISFKWIGWPSVKLKKKKKFARTEKFDQKLAYM